MRTNDSKCVFRLFSSKYHDAFISLIDDIIILKGFFLNADTDAEVLAFFGVCH